MESLFRITETYELELNKEWILMIPEFSAILKSDKGSTGDSEGRKKVKSKKVLAYIYFMVDFKSPIESWEFGKRHLEALRYTDLKEADVATKLVKTALDYYDHLQKENARALKSLASARKAVDALDSYFDNLNFSERDKMGKLLHSPKEVGASVEQLNKIYDSLDKFEKRVKEELKESTTIRGNASLGDREGRRSNAGVAQTWSESSQDPNQKPILTGSRFTDLSILVDEMKKADKEVDEISNRNEDEEPEDFEDTLDKEE